MDPHRRLLILGAVLAGGALLTGVMPAACARLTRPAQSAARPTRPSGEPKPMLDEDIAPVLARLDAWFAANLRDRRYAFNPPASEAAIDRFQRRIGRPLPRSWRQLYRWHDGENDDRWGHFYGLPLLSLGQAEAEWIVWGKVLAELGDDPYVVRGASWPAGAIDPAYGNPGWIPLTADGSGNHIGIDLAPWPGGRVGQVILFGRDEDVKVVLAPSLGRFLGWIADLLEGGNVRLGKDPGETILREFRLKSPAVDHFHEGARRLLGAPGQFL
ncbi:SMI1/KNR4 family protein [Sphingomonas swuensis]